MPAKTIQGTQELAKKIKQRRTEMGLTIEEAATRAGVGTKTWCRYETGASIRTDKCRGICRALNWSTFPGDKGNDADGWNIEEYKKLESWSPYLEKCFGETAAASFAAGSDILLDNIEEDMQELSEMPRGTHLGQLRISLLADELPKQFLMRYDYDFIYSMYTVLLRLRAQAHVGSEMNAHSVMEELLIYLSVENSSLLMEAGGIPLEKDWDEWVFDLFEDCDIVTYLYSNYYITNEHCYHFDRWMEE